MGSIKLAPSILSADFARLGEQVREASEAGADYIHVDVMDGRFVPNLTIGPLVVAAIRPHTSLPLDVHLMVVEPEHLIPDFVSAGADKVTVHQEAVPELRRAVHLIKELGATAGVAISPDTPPSALEDVIADRHSTTLRGYAWVVGGGDYVVENPGDITGYPGFSRSVALLETKADLVTIAPPPLGYLTVTVTVGWVDAKGDNKTLDISTVLTEYTP